MKVYRFQRFAVIVRGAAAMTGLLGLVPAASPSSHRPGLFKIELTPTAALPSAHGIVNMTPGRSPFGISLTPDGHFIFELELSVTGLPPAASLGPYREYDAWVVTADLVQTERIGVVTPDKSVRGHVAMNKFLVVVTAETAASGTHWKGPIVLRGFAPSALLENFSGKTMFNGGMPQE